MAAIVEHRNFGAKLEVRDAGEKPRLAGYAAKFKQALATTGRDAVSREDSSRTHSTRRSPATRTSASRSITIRTTCWDARAPARSGSRPIAPALRFDLDAPDTARGRYLVASVKRGDISDCSFSFRTLDDHWSKDQDGSPIRTLKKVSLH